MTVNMLLRVGAVGLLIFLQSGDGDAFRAATSTTTSTTPATTSTTSSDRQQQRQRIPAQQQQQQRPAHKHEFWRKARSHKEVKAHVTKCLVEIDEQHDVSSSLTRTSNNNNNNNTNKRREQVQVLSAEPPLVLIHDVLSPQMCRDLIQTAKTANGGMAPSRTGAEQNLSQSRTSTTVWLTDRDATDCSRLIAEVVSSISGLPANCQENLQVARYEPGQQFQLHTDHQDSFNDLECRGRLATFLIYLDAPEQGGATHFPCVNDDHDNECGMGDVCVPPLAGSAVFFFNTVQKPGCDDYDAEMFLDADLRMRHAGLPVEEGEKWICNRWVHPIEFGAGVRGLVANNNEKAAAAAAAATV